MKRKHFYTIFIILISFWIVLSMGCGNTTVGQLKNEYGVLLEGGAFEEGSLLVSNEVSLNTDEQC